MSAYMVSKEHIDAILCVVVEGPAQSGKTTHEWQVIIAYTDLFPKGTGDPLNALGDLLVRENLSSIHSRYPDTVTDLENTPGPIAQYWLREYVYRHPARKPNVIEALKLIDCYEYQSCEHPEWPGSQAKKICDRLRCLLVSALPGYEKASWGWDEVAA